MKREIDYDVKPYTQKERERVCLTDKEFFDLVKDRHTMLIGQERDWDAPHWGYALFDVARMLGIIQNEEL